MVAASQTGQARQINYDMKVFTAIAIVAVCAGHLGAPGLSGPFDLFPPYSYQVAAFVFASGYFYSERSESAVAAYVARKARRLIAPLLLINATYGVACAALRRFAGLQYGEPLGAWSLLVSPFTSGHAFVLNGPMWFIAPLFFAEVVNVCVRRAARPLRGGVAKESLLFAAYLAAGAVAIRVGGAEGLPAGPLLAACRTMFFLSCLGMGRFYRAVLESRDTARSLPYFLVVMALQLAVTYLCDGRPVYNSAWCRFYNGVALTYAATATSIAFMLRVSKVLGPAIGRSRVVLALADNSFSIMCHHFFGYFLVSLALGLVAAHTPLLASFDAGALMSVQTGYFFLPGGMAQFTAAYLVAGVGFSLTVHGAWTAAKRAAARLLPW